MTAPEQAEQLALLLSLQPELALETAIEIVLHQIEAKKGLRDIPVRPPAGRASRGRSRRGRARARGAHERDERLARLRAERDLDGPARARGRGRRVHQLREAANNAVTGLVDDDGAGFDVAATLGSYSGRASRGPLQMREAARLIGARLSIDSSPGNETRVRLRIPKSVGPVGPA
jgi:hypothetical protein